VHYEPTLGTSLAGQLSLLRQHPGVVAVVTEKKDEGWAMAVRLMGRRSSVDAQLQSFQNDLGTQTEVREGEAPWAEYNERWADGDENVRMVIGGRAEAIHKLALELAGLDGNRGLSVSLGTGTLRVAIHPESASREQIVSRLARHPVTWTVESAPAAWRGRDSVWGPMREDHVLSQAIKDQFDPSHILNRGRLFI
jgi:hypothetical protein